MAPRGLMVFIAAAAVFTAPLAFAQVDKKEQVKEQLPPVAESPRVAPRTSAAPKSTTARGGASPSAANPFSDWAAVVVAGDFRAHSGVPAETFDNARRDLSAAFVKFGIKPENLSQFSVRPGSYPDQTLLQTDRTQVLSDELKRLTAKAPAGCLLYFTSHGNTDGILYANTILSPSRMAGIIGEACGDRPTAVFVSACFSGVFVPALSASNRFVMTAARPDRSSFGCGESNVYTFFDTCMLETLPNAKTLDALATEVKACVVKAEAVLREETRADLTQACEARARELGLAASVVPDCVESNSRGGLVPPSEPQVAIGETIRPLLATLTLESRAAPTVRAGARGAAPGR